MFHKPPVPTLFRELAFSCYTAKSVIFTRYHYHLTSNTFFVNASVNDVVTTWIIIIGTNHHQLKKTFPLNHQPNRLKIKKIIV